MNDVVHYRQEIYLPAIERIKASLRRWNADGEEDLPDALSEPSESASEPAAVAAVSLSAVPEWEN